MSDRACTQAAPTPHAVEQRTDWSFCMFKAVLAILTAPYRRTFKLYTWRPLKEIRAAGGDRKILIPLVRDWKADKYAELQSVQVAASFCAGATLSTIPWSRNYNPHWTSDALWFSSLICSIWAVITSIQTKSILDDLPNKDDLTASLAESEVQRMRRVILRYKKRPGIKHWIMVFIWQFPSMTMSYAWCTFICGLAVFLCTPFIRLTPWDNRHKISIVSLTIGTIGLIAYILSSIWVYMGEKDFERSVTSTRASANQLESGVSFNGANHGAQVSANKRRQGSNSAEGADPIQTLRGFIEGESEMSGRSKRQLLI